MSIIIKVTVTGTDTENTLLTALRALSNAGYQDLHYPETVMAQSIIVIDGAIDAKNLKSFELALQNTINAVTKNVRIDGIEIRNNLSLANLNRYADHLYKELSKIAGQPVSIISDIALAAVQSIQNLNNKEIEYKKAWDKANKPEPIVYEDTDEFFNSRSPSAAANSMIGGMSAHYSPFSSFDEFGIHRSSMSHNDTHQDLISRAIGGGHAGFGNNSFGNHSAYDHMQEQNARIHAQNARIMREHEEEQRRRADESNRRIFAESRRERAKTDEQNNRLIFESSQRRYRQQLKNSIFAEGDKTLSTTIACIDKMKALQRSNIAVAGNWLETYYGLTNSLSLNITDNNSNYMVINLHLSNSTPLHDFKMRNDCYTFDVNSFVEALRGFMGSLKLTIKFNPSTCDKASITIHNLNEIKSLRVIDHNLQLALIVANLRTAKVERANSLSVNKTYHLPATINDAIAFASVVTPNTAIKSNYSDALKAKYKLADFSDAALEKALRMAAANNMPEDILILVQIFKVNVNAQDTNPASRKSALHLAVERGHTACVKTLLLSDANVHINDAKGMTSRMLASALGNDEIAKLVGVQLSAAAAAASPIKLSSN